jgi:hypothetical protein
VNEPIKDLEQRIARLGREVAPQRDLWPGIERQVRRRPRRPAFALWAAGIAAAAASIAAVSTWAMLHRVVASEGVPMVAAASPFSEPRDANYVRARDALRQTFRERLAMLDPATRNQIESSLAVIRHAQDDIRNALAGQPDSEVLQQLWESTWHDEFDLYDRVVRSTQPSMTRT